jgi:hypothetical protein
MKDSKTFTLTLILLIFQTAYPQTHKPRDSVFQRSIAADRAWLPFYKRLQTAVKRRDRARLKEMMIPEFQYTLGHHVNQEFDSREDAFKWWDRPDIHGWKELDRTLAQGAVQMAAWWREGNQQKSPPTRVAPPSANTKWRIDIGLINYVAMFEYHNGRWYFVSFDVCCD